MLIHLYKTILNNLPVKTIWSMLVTSMYFKVTSGRYLVYPDTETALEKSNTTAKAWQAILTSKVHQ